MKLKYRKYNWKNIPVKYRFWLEKLKLRGGLSVFNQIVSSWDNPINDNNIVVVCLDDDIPIGWSILELDNFRVGVYVKPLWRQNGIGTKLLKKAKGILDKANHISLYGLPGNYKGMRTFKSAGIKYFDWRNI